MKYFSLTLIIVWAFGFIEPASAQNLAGAAQCTGTDCSACNLVYLANAVIQWLIGFLTILFAVLMAVAGWGLVVSGGNQSALDAAKEKFTNAVIGFIIILAAWLVIDTIIRGLVGADGMIEGSTSGAFFWAEVQCQSQIAANEADEVAINLGIVREGNIADPISADVQPPAPGSVTTGGMTHVDAARQLAGNNISIVSSGNCSDRTNPRCTSLDGIRPLTLAKAVELQQLVGAPLVVTGGTEVGHASGPYSHANGYKLDFRTTPELNNYIQNNYTNIGGTRWRDASGNIYYRHEPDHWDITFTND